uniref:Uncharacterized protein n=1 Tax=viral metagenome TaxID=1070528 RepID=A0A6M3LYS7_9ZZZZ
MTKQPKQAKKPDVGKTHVYKSGEESQPEQSQWETEIHIVFDDFFGGYGEY